MRREIATVVLYVAVVLLATIVALPAEELEAEESIAAIIWGAAGGLALAHWFAFHLAGQLYAGDRVEAEELLSGASQVTAALGVAFVATVPLFISRGEAGAGSAALVLAGVIALVGYRTSRRMGARPARAVLHSAGTLAIGGVVVAIKVLLHH